MVQVAHPLLALLALLLFFGVGLLALAGALREYRRVTRLVHQGRRVMGLVVAIEEKIGRPQVGRPGSQMVFWCPVIEFTDDRSRTLRFTARGSANRSAFQLRQSLPLFYDPAQPDAQPPCRATLDRFWDLWGGAVVSGILGASFCGFVLVFVWLMLR